MLFAALGGTTALYLAYLAGLPVGVAESLCERWLGLVVEAVAMLACVGRVVFVREERRIWALIAVGVSLWTLGDVYWRIALWNREVMPVPSLADVGWLAFYVPIYIRGDRALPVGRAPCRAPADRPRPPGALRGRGRSCPQGCCSTSTRSPRRTTDPKPASATVFDSVITCWYLGHPIPPPRI